MTARAKGSMWTWIYRGAMTLLGTLSFAVLQHTATRLSDMEKKIDALTHSEDVDHTQFRSNDLVHADRIRQLNWDVRQLQHLTQVPETE